MSRFGIRNPHSNLQDLGIKKVHAAYWNLSSTQLIEHSLKEDRGKLTDKGALIVQSPSSTNAITDRIIVVKERHSDSPVNWNIAPPNCSPETFDKLTYQFCKYLEDRTLYIKDFTIGPDQLLNHRFRVICDTPWISLFLNHMYYAPSSDQLMGFDPDWTLFCAPITNFQDIEDLVEYDRFIVINFEAKKVLIRGNYSPEDLQKSLRYISQIALPSNSNMISVEGTVLSLNNSLNAFIVGQQNLFRSYLSNTFEGLVITEGFSGWSSSGVFPLEKGARVPLDQTSVDHQWLDSQIDRFGNLLENLPFIPNSRKVDLTHDKSGDHLAFSYTSLNIANETTPNYHPTPKHIFLLTSDAKGVLPLVAKLSIDQALFYYLNGYSTKIQDSKKYPYNTPVQFSPCYHTERPLIDPISLSQQFFNLHAPGTSYWLINVGWMGGDFRKGERVSSELARQIILKVANGALQKVPFEQQQIFGFEIPLLFPGISFEKLNPRNAWSDKFEYDQSAMTLAKSLMENFKPYQEILGDIYKNGGPTLHSVDQQSV